MRCCCAAAAVPGTDRLVDRFGRTQTFHREAAGEFSGEITGVTDGAGVTSGWY